MAAPFPGSGGFVGNPGGKGGPSVQPWFGGGGGLGGGVSTAYGIMGPGGKRRRLPFPGNPMAGAMPIGAQAPPQPQPGALPYMGPQPTQFNKPPNVNVYQDYPGFHPLNVGLDRLGSFWKKFGTSQGEAKRLSESAMAFNGMSFPGRQAGGAGYGLSAQPSDALKRLMAARFGGV